MIDVIDAIDDDGSLAQAASDPFLSPLLIAPDLRAATIQIELDDDLQQIGDLSPVVHTITDRLRSISTPSGYTLHVTGVPFVRTEVVDMMVSDEMTFMPLVTLVFLVTILILFRRLWLGLPLVGVLFATIWAVGLLLSQGAVFNILSILTPTLILVIGVADGIHLVNRYREELAHDDDREAAMGRTIGHLSLACFLTTFTTAAGFVSLTVADTAVIRDFGQQVAVGVMVTFFALMMVVPTLLAWIPVAKVGRPEDVLEHPIYDRLSRLVSTRPKHILVVTLSLTLFAGWLGRDVTTDSGLLEMYHDEHPTTAVVTAQEKTGGIIPIFIHIEGEPDQMLEPEVLRGIDALETRLAAMPMAGFTTSPAAWVQHFHRLLTGEDGQAGDPRGGGTRDSPGRDEWRAATGCGPVSRSGTRASSRSPVTPAAGSSSRPRPSWSTLRPRSSLTPASQWMSRATACWPPAAWTSSSTICSPASSSCLASSCSR